MFFLETAFKTTVLLAAAGLATIFLRRHSAAVRHQVWSIAFAALMALPLLAITLPAWRMPIANSLLNNNPLWRIEAAAALPVTAVQGPAETGKVSVAIKRTRQNFAVLAAALWALGTLISFVQMAIGWAAVTRLRRRARPIKLPGFASLASGRSVDLRQTAAGSMPITCGIWHPAVLLPADEMKWTEERRRIVLLHELAHIQRHDAATNLLARTALALYWWNPLVWKAWGEFLKERERAADDLVLLHSGTVATAYATHLLAIARSMQLSPAIGSAVVAMARPSQLEGRLAAILDSSRSRKTPPRAFAITVSLAALICLVPMSALRAQNSSPAIAGNSTANLSPGAKLIQSGDQARLDHQFDAAKTFYGEALGLSSGHGLDAAAALFGLGKTALTANDYPAAMSYFDRVSAADPKAASEANLWSAIAQQRQGNLDAADKLYQAALTLAESNSASAATIMNIYVGLLRALNRDADAARMTAQAAAIRKSLAPNVMLPSGVYRSGGDVKAPGLISKVEPQYSEDARLAKYSGSIVLSVEIGQDGLAHNVQVVRGLGFGLDEKAIEAINQWKFSPGTLNGVPVPIAANIEVNFRLL